MVQKQVTAAAAPGGIRISNSTAGREIPEACGIVGRDGRSASEYACTRALDAI